MRITLPILLILVLAAPGLAGDDEAATRPLAIGDTVPAFELTDLDGGAFSLAAARTIDEAEAKAHVLQSAKKLGALKGDEEAVDPGKAHALLRAAGTRYGLMATEEAAGDIESVGDVVEWITGSAEAPIVFMCWSPMCPTSRRYEQRIQDLVAAAGARFYPLASYSAKKERNEDTRDYVKTNDLPYRVLLDREQKATDIFGGKVTPHVFVLDPENRLVYAGSIDSDPNLETKSPYERRNWLADALEAIANEQPVDVMRTRAKG